MQGNIDFTGSLSGSIAGGGSGGSDVTITPTLQSGTKIADYTIDETSGSLYAPTPEGLTAELPLIISNNTISIDLSNYVTSSALETILEDYPTYTYTESRYTPLATFNAYTISAESHFQRTLTAGANITIDPVTDTISASSGSSWDYSTTEVNTGQKWIDGKDIYCKVFNLTIPNQTGTVTFSNPTPNLNEVIDVRYSVNGKGPVYETPWYSSASVYFDSMDSNGIYFYFSSNYNKDRPLRAFAFYTKTSS